VQEERNHPSKLKAMVRQKTASQSPVAGRTVPSKIGEKEVFEYPWPEAGRRELRTTVGLGTKTFFFV